MSCHTKFCSTVEYFILYQSAIMNNEQYLVSPGQDGGENNADDV